MPQFNDIQTIKRKLYAMRNGITADALRRAGSPHRLIFGVNLPQLSEIAANSPRSAEIARTLWNDTALRESMLLAPMLFPPEDMTYEESCRWLETSSGTECADILCHKLLRHLPYARQLAFDYVEAQNPLWRYSAFRILWHFITGDSADILSAAQQELAKKEPMTTRLATQTIDEIQFLSEI